MFTVAELDTLETLCEAAAEVHGDSFNALRIQPQLLQMSLSSRPLSCIRVFYNHLWQLHVCAGVWSGWLVGAHVRSVCRIEMISWPEHSLCLQLVFCFFASQPSSSSCCGRSICVTPWGLCRRPSTSLATWPSLFTMSLCCQLYSTSSGKSSSSQWFGTMRFFLLNLKKMQIYSIVLLHHTRKLVKVIWDK